MVALTRTGRVSDRDTERGLASPRFAQWEVERLSAVTIGDAIRLKALYGAKSGLILSNYLWLVALLVGMVLAVAFCGGATDATDRSPEARMVEKWPWE